MADMIGVVVHLTGDAAEAAGDHGSDYLYTAFRDRGPRGGPGWMALMAAAGFRHVRCDTGSTIAPGTTSAQLRALETMRLLDTVRPAFSPPHVTGIDKVFLSSTNLMADLPVLRSGAGRVWMIEGPDESWPPNGKFIPSFVVSNDTVYMCTHAIARVNASAPGSDPGRWVPCRVRGSWSPRQAYGPGDIVMFDGGTWTPPVGSAPPVDVTPPGAGWWQASSGQLPRFTSGAPGIYYGYEDAGALGVAWGEYIAACLGVDNRASGGHWSHAGHGGGPTRIATWSAVGMDIYSWWDPANDAALLPRYRSSMPGGATNVHLYESYQPTDMAATCGASLGQAGTVLPGYAVYLGEIGQATYPTDDVLALGKAAVAATPTSLVQNPSGKFPLDQTGRPMPGTTTGRMGAEPAQAQKLTRSWAEMFRLAPGGSRAAVYELLNEPFAGYRDFTGEWGYPASGGPYFDYSRSEGNFGLLRSDFSAKPAYTAIANTCALMGDTGSQTFVTDAITYQITRQDPTRPGADARFGPYDLLRSVPTQGSDRVFRIPVWYTNVHATDELFPGIALNRMTSPAPTERVVLRVLTESPGRIEAYNTAVSAQTPVIAVTRSSAITWVQTADLWIIKVHP
jgi:hypothetical protein